MTHRTDAIERTLLRRGYSECRPGPDYRRFRISPTHARRVEIYSSRRRRWLFGDLFLTEQGRLMLGISRQCALTVPPETIANLLRDGQEAKPTRRVKLGPPMTIEELMAE